MTKGRDDIGGPAAQGVRTVPRGKLPDKAGPLTAPVLGGHTTPPEEQPPKPDKITVHATVTDDGPKLSRCIRASSNKLVMSCRVRACRVASLLA